jgi:hypothetical protein
MDILLGTIGVTLLFGLAIVLIYDSYDRRNKA